MDLLTAMHAQIGEFSLGVTDYAVACEGVYDGQGRRSGTKIDLAINGEIEAASTEDLAGAMIDFRAALLGDGRSVAVYCGEELMESISPADCTDGPRIKGSVGAELSGGTSRRVSVSVEAVLAAGAGGGLPTNVLSEEKTIKWAKNVEGRKTVTISGKVSTKPGASAWDRAAAKLPPSLPGWQLTTELEQNAADTEASYSSVEIELAAEYPGDFGGIVDGEFTMTTAFDEHNGQTLQYDYSYVGPQAAAWMWRKLATLREALYVVSARVAVSKHKTEAAQGQFTAIASADNQYWLSATETITAGGTGPLLEERRYAGADPLIVRAATPGYSYTQSGRSVGVGGWPAPPPPAYDQAYLAERPEYSFQTVDAQRRETTWRYRFIFPDEQLAREPAGLAGVTGEMAALGGSLALPWGDPPTPLGEGLE